MLVSLLSDEDLSKISAAVLGDDSAMDDIPLFSPAGEQAWRAYDYHMILWHCGNECAR